MSYFTLSHLAFSINYCLVTLLDRKLQLFKNSPKWTIFGIFNVNVACFAHNVECDFFYDFQTLCS